MKFLFKRLAHAAALILVVSAAAFLMLEAAPGDFASDLDANPSIPEATVEKLRRDYALDAGLIYRFERWLRSMLRGEMGISIARNQPVGPILWPRAWNTLRLSAIGLAAAWLIGVPLGALAAARRRSWTSRASGAAVTALVAMPDLFIALALLLLAVRTGWFPVSGSLASASCALTLIALPAVFRHTRASVRATLAEPFVESARAHGLPGLRVWIGHTLPAAAGPMISLLGLSISSLLSASLIVEIVLGWPGLGPLLLEAVASRDHHVVLASVVISSALLAAGNLAADLLLFAADPRIRREAL